MAAVNIGAEEGLPYEYDLAAFQMTNGKFMCKGLVITLMIGICLCLVQHYLTGLEKNIKDGAQNECQKLNMKIPRSLVAITKCLVRAYGEVVTVFNYQC